MPVSIGAEHDDGSSYVPVSVDVDLGGRRCHAPVNVLNVDVAVIE